jgi:hypothetical protein
MDNDNDNVIARADALNPFWRGPSVRAEDGVVLIPLGSPTPGGKVQWTGPYCGVVHVAPYGMDNPTEADIVSVPFRIVE